MRHRLLSHPLQSRVGRRIASVVLVSALTPVVVIGGVLWSRAHEQQEALEQARLHQQAKTLALNGLERLAFLEQRLRWIADGDGAGSSVGLDLAAMLGPFDGVDALVIWESIDRPPATLRGTATAPVLDREQAQRIRGGEALLAADGSRRYWVVAPGQRPGSAAAGRLPLRDIFGLGENSLLPPSTTTRLFDDEGRLVASSGGSSIDGHVSLGTGPLVGELGLPSHGGGEVVIDGVGYRTRTWALPLGRGYGAGVWTIALIEPRAASRVALDRFARDVLLLSTLSVIVVVLAVLFAIRRSLRPLGSLELAAARVAQHEFDVSVQVESDDEFRDLARGFNTMVAELRTRFEALEAFSEGTATALARTIDAKSPWTAGHSDRVTTLALEIGREMGLSPADLELLNRGGLLHDIGKLATPQQILEKAGPLTTEERRVVERHPLDGARILEPIPKFAPIIPMVLQHHERFDGAGYPHRLKGREISLLARILSVADVFDALSSDRPYRSGWERTDVLAYVRAAAGSHFDPDVAAAFARVMARREPQSSVSRLAS